MSTVFTASGEVAQYVDDNQFGSGQSQDKCGPEAVSVFYHSTKVGTKNPYTATDVHAMAHDDYVKYIGQDVTSDTGGTSNALLYRMLSDHGFQFKEGPTNSVEWIRNWLLVGYPVIIGISESSVVDQDADVNGNPYNWNPAGLFHIVVVTGPGSGDTLLIRDTANIDKTGKVRPGPRKYQASKLALTSATMVVPSWLPVPSSATPPTPVSTPDYVAQVKNLTAQLSQAVSHL